MYVYVKMAATCNVCVSPFNKSTRREVTCAQCEFSACRDCNKRYILGTVNEPHCMNCKVPWNSEFITENFTKKFFNEDLAEHRANVLFENEKAHMPATQEHIRVMHARREVAALRDMANMYDTIRRPDEAARYRRMVHQIIVENPEADGDEGPSTAAAPKAVKARPVCGCIRDDCRGFIMNDSWKCGLCNTKVCNGCLKANEEGHECNDDDKATRQALLKNTKPCPKCAAMIFKTEGCSQMWCVMCHTTFDWNSGEIVTGYVHNPHFFEWARRNGRAIPRAPGDEPPQAVACNGGIPPHEFFLQFARVMERSHGWKTNDVNTIIRLYRVTTHMNDVTRARLRPRNQDEMRDDLRMKYLLDEITVDNYKTQLIKMERSREMVTALWHIAELFIRQATDTLRFVYNTRPTKLSCPEMTEVIELAKYCNEQFKKVARAYKQGSWFRINLESGYCGMTKQA